MNDDSIFPYRNESEYQSALARYCSTHASGVRSKTWLYRILAHLLRDRGRNNAEDICYAISRLSDRGRDMPSVTSALSRMVRAGYIFEDGTKPSSKANDSTVYIINTAPPADAYAKFKNREHNTPHWTKAMWAFFLSKGVRLPKTIPPTAANRIRVLVKVMAGEMGIDIAGVKW